jgi:hypothetical protein
MSAISNYLENAIINHTLRNVPFTAPTTIYLALFLTAPLDSGTGTEVSGGAYARQVVTFVAPSDGATTNVSDVVFPVATADWGTISHLGLYSAATGGNLLYHGAFTLSKVIQTGDQFIVRAGDLDITIA